MTELKKCLDPHVNSVTIALNKRCLEISSERDRLRKALERINSIADRYWKDELTGDEAAIKLVKTLNEINDEARAKALRGENETATS